MTHLSWRAFLVVWLGTAFAACAGNGVESDDTGSPPDSLQDGFRADGSLDSRGDTDRVDGLVDVRADRGSDTAAPIDAHTSDTGPRDTIAERASEGGGATDAPTSDTAHIDAIADRASEGGGAMDAPTSDTAHIDVIGERISDSGGNIDAASDGGSLLDAVNADHGADATMRDSSGADVAADAGSGQDTSVPDSGVVHPTTPIIMAINTADRRYAIPENYVGISFPRDNISGQNNLRDLFIPGSATEMQLANLYRQIGIKHIRVLSHDARVQDPTNTENDAFFRFAQEAEISPSSIIYSLNDEYLPPNYTDDRETAVYLWSHYSSMIESFAIGNESDWFIPSIFSSYDSTGPDPFLPRWVSVYTGIQSALATAGLREAPFSGPDTGSEYPARPASTAVDCVPFTLRFANDEISRISYATQHYYGGDTREALPWSTGTTYYVGDAIQDTNGYTYQCTQDDPDSQQDPSLSSKWTRFPPRWSPNVSYTQGEFVQDPNHLGTDYRCVSSCPASSVSPSELLATDPDAGMQLWVSEREAVLSAYQMAKHMLESAWLDQYQVLFDRALAGATTSMTSGSCTTPAWPAGLRYRLTEGNAYSWGRDPNSHLFALALWAVDFFHWWAAHGAMGVDPFTILNFFNAPLYQGPGGTEIVAEPYAYGMLAFGQGMRGTTIPMQAVRLTTAPTWLTIYPVVGSGHLYITFVNKTFNRIGSQDALVAIVPSPFTPVHAQLLRLESAPGATGDATTDTACLGGQTIVTGGQWAGAWEQVQVTSGGAVGPVRVRATSAVVLDITDH